MECGNGFSGKSASLTCRSGSWTGTQIECHRDCLRFSYPGHRVRILNLQHGSTAHIECSDGLTGMATSVCQNGAWSSFELVCRPTTTTIRTATPSSSMTIRYPDRPVTFRPSALPDSPKSTTSAFEAAATTSKAFATTTTTTTEPIAHMVSLRNASTSMDILPTSSSTTVTSTQWSGVTLPWRNLTTIRSEILSDPGSQAVVALILTAAFAVILFAALVVVICRLRTSRYHGRQMQALLDRAELTAAALSERLAQLERLVEHRLPALHGLYCRLRGLQVEEPVRPVVQQKRCVPWNSVVPVRQRSGRVAYVDIQNIRAGDTVLGLYFDPLVRTGPQMQTLLVQWAGIADEQEADLWAITPCLDSQHFKLMLSGDHELPCAAIRGTTRTHRGRPGRVPRAAIPPCTMLRADHVTEQYDLVVVQDTDMRRVASATNARLEMLGVKARLAHVMLQPQRQQGATTQLVALEFASTAPRALTALLLQAPRANAARAGRGMSQVWVAVHDSEPRQWTQARVEHMLQRLNLHPDPMRCLQREPFYECSRRCWQSALPHSLRRSSSWDGLLQANQMHSNDDEGRDTSMRSALGQIWGHNLVGLIETERLAQWRRDEEASAVQEGTAQGTGGDQSSEQPEIISMANSVLAEDVGRATSPGRTGILRRVKSWEGPVAQHSAGCNEAELEERVKALRAEFQVGRMRLHQFRSDQERWRRPGRVIVHL